MPKSPTSVDEYLDPLPADRRETIDAVRKVIRKNIDKKFEEGIQYGMVGYYLPHSVYPDGYHCDPRQPLPFASVASQKNHIGLYLFCVYVDPDTLGWFTSAWKAAGKKLDMGKSCVRVKKLDDIPLDVLGELFRRVRAKDFVASYEASRADSKSRKVAKKPAGKKAAGKKAVVRSSAAKKPAAKKPVAKKKASKKPAAKRATR